uniref:Pept_C1 domain-containing protein n=1 Tax=Steinernema glaseri TaxID=37863 RepID=A0A1I7ZLP6_9BILA
MYHYEDGTGVIITKESTNRICKELNHEVLILGYGRKEGKDYWIVRESKGPDVGPPATSSSRRGGTSTE